LRTGETPGGAIRDNIRSLAMVYAAVDSARDGRLVAIGEVLARASAQGVQPGGVLPSGRRSRS
jgi:hypothetical protein